MAVFLPNPCNNPCIGPQTGGGPIASRDLVGGAGARMASFRPNLVPGPLANASQARLEAQGSILKGLATILDPYRVIFADLGPDRQMSAVETG